MKSKKKVERFLNLPEKPRNSLVIQTLAGLLNSPPRGEFDYEARLVELEKRVSAEVSYINTLFPDYTPHNSRYHLDRLFYVADMVVEQSRLTKLNATELFVLASSLYAHDWGMAVSKIERKAIENLVDGKLPSTRTVLLPDEVERLHRFAKSHGCTTKDVVKADEQWRDYVRETHPDRSAARVRAFFAKEGGGIGDAIARVSRGHGVDVAELEKPDAFPQNFSAQGETVNLRGLAVYVRLVDLLDIADDRTPYALWKYVRPEDLKSSNEWSKHRSLNPITFPPYQSGRTVQVDGSTSDPGVWAALRDLERYVRDQLRACSDVLARMGDNRFYLDLSIVEWRIDTPGFSPKDLRFEFQREKMFHILSEEVYEGDVYVFLRELIQNCIDAIRLRKKLWLDNEGTNLHGIIHFKVERKSNGDAVICCRDNGTGMDENIIRNYLALAGRSYYSSDEFKHLGLPIDAIARFGIGILSCFMAGDSIKIETSRDKFLAPNSESIKLVIPAVEQQFRVYAGDQQLKIGTSVTVYVSGKKLKTALLGWNSTVRVVDYIAQVAGFTEFPILISEGNTHTLVLHPFHDPDEGKQLALRQAPIGIKLGKLEIVQAARDYPWSFVFLPQDEFEAKSNLCVKWLKLKEDLDMQDIEGKIGFLIPKDETVFVEREPYSGSEHTTVFCDAVGGIKAALRWFDSYHRSRREESVPRSISSDAVTHVSHNGILVAGNRRDQPSRSDTMFPECSLWMNFPRGTKTRLSVSRFTSIDDDMTWRDRVRLKAQEHLINSEYDDLCGMQPLQRFNRLGRLMSWYEIESDLVLACMPMEMIPVARIRLAGEVEVLNASSICGDWQLIPELLVFECRNVLRAVVNGWSPDYPTHLESWPDEPSVITYNHGSVINYATSASSLASRFCDIWRPVIKIRFLTSTLKRARIIPQVVRAESCLDMDSDELLAKKAISNPELLHFDDWSRSSSFVHGVFQTYGSESGSFATPFQNLFACGCASFNTNHILVQSLVRCKIALDLAMKRKSISPLELGKLSDSWKALFNQVNNDLYSPSLCQQLIDMCFDKFRTSKLLELPSGIVAPNLDDYVPGSAILNGEFLRLMESTSYYNVGQLLPGRFGKVVA